MYELCFYFREMDSTENIENSIENTCRVCLSSYNLTGIFQKHEGMLISEMITEISGLKVEKSDLLSKKICKECKSKTIEFYAFRAMCIDSDYTVRFNIADENDVVIDGSETHSEETAKKSADDDLTHLDEYFIEDEESVTHSEFQEQIDQDQHTIVFDDELFVHNDDDDDDHHILADVESVESSSEANANARSMVVIERVDSKLSAANSIILEPSDELTTKMREAHFAKEQQKKHKCPHCDKYFMFPSKGTLITCTCTLIEATFSSS